MCHKDQMNSNLPSIESTQFFSFLYLFPPSFVLGLFAHFSLCKTVQSNREGHQDEEIM